VESSATSENPPVEESAKSAVNSATVSEQSAGAVLSIPLSPMSPMDESVAVEVPSGQLSPSEEEHDRQSSRALPSQKRYRKKRMMMSGNVVLIA
jgi:hypothetical protein